MTSQIYPAMARRWANPNPETLHYWMAASSDPECDIASCSGCHQPMDDNVVYNSVCPTPKAETLAMVYRDNYVANRDVRVIEIGPYGHQVLMRFTRIGGSDVQAVLLDIDQARELYLQLGAELEIAQRTTAGDPAVIGGVGPASDPACPDCGGTLCAVTQTDTERPWACIDCDSTFEDEEIQ